MGSVPNKQGRFGPYGGRYVPETLMPALLELEQEYARVKKDRGFQSELAYYLKHYAGRPTALYFAQRLTKRLGGAKIYLKREDLCHTGAHKINNAIGQGLLARRMKKPRVIAETGAGQHGVATATVAAMFGLQCEVYMGTEDMQRQALNVFRMRLLGATVTGVNAGSRTLKDAISEAMRDWTTNIRTTHYILGSVLGAHPYPMMIRDFQSIIGRETRRQILAAEGRLPDSLIACVGGGSNAIGLFHAFILDKKVKMIGVEAGGMGVASGKHAARFAGGRPGVLQGTMTYLLQGDDGQVNLTHSVSAGLDYAAIGPEHSYLRDQGRAEYTSVTDDEAMAAFDLLAREEGIMPALESAHAIAHTVKVAPTMKKNQILVVNLSGRGDKDVQHDSQNSRDHAVTSRLDHTFAQLRQRGEKALIAYVMAGDPSLQETEQLVVELEQAGADIIELGVPFSDPIADGPVIQQAAERALRSGTSLRTILPMVTRLRARTQIPLVLMAYYNNIHAFGAERFCHEAAQAGVDGLILPDMPPDEAGPLKGPAAAAGLQLIFLLAPTSTAKRRTFVARQSQGFVYYVSLTGITGAKLPNLADVGKNVEKIRKVTRVPVAVGFGVATPEDAAKVAAIADGVIVGSAIVKLIAAHRQKPEMVKRVAEFVRSLKTAMRAAQPKTR